MDRPSLKTFVLDTAAITAGIIPTGASNYITTQIADEASRFLSAFDESIFRLRLSILDPAAEHVEEAKKAARATGDLAKLSLADISLISLALHLKVKGLRPEVISDDFAVLNVCASMGIKYTTATLTKNDFTLIRWLWYCPRCGKTYSYGTERCSGCQVSLRRKVKR